MTLPWLVAQVGARDAAAIEARLDATGNTVSVDVALASWYKLTEERRDAFRSTATPDEATERLLHDGAVILRTDEDRAAAPQVGDVTTRTFPSGGTVSFVIGDGLADVEADGRYVERRRWPELCAHLGGDAIVTVDPDTGLEIFPVPDASA